MFFIYAQKIPHTSTNPPLGLSIFEKQLCMLGIAQQTVLFKIDSYLVLKWSKCYVHSLIFNIS